MKKYAAISTLAALTMALSTVPAWSAEPATDADQVKRQEVVTPSLRQAVASAAGVALQNVEIKPQKYEFVKNDSTIQIFYTYLRLRIMND